MTVLTTTDADRILDTITTGDGERLARVALAICTEPGNPQVGRLDQHSAIALVRRILDNELARRDGRRNDLTGLVTTRWPRLTAATFHDVLQTTEPRGYRVLIPGDDHWPAALADLGDAQPVALWVTGDSALLAAPPEQNIAVTGSRACTAYGERTASEIARDLATLGYTIMAGGAYGIESAAHRAALAADARTVAVLAAGLDRPHPRNADLFRRIAESGALLSEAPPGATPSRTQFVQRGRIIAGLCATTVVVEANTRSGALAVAHRALALSRTVAAVPGPVTSVTSTGCHRLIQDGETRLVTDAEDILAALISSPHTRSATAAGRPAPSIGTRLTSRASSPPQSLISSTASTAQDMQDSPKIPAGPCIGITRPTFTVAAPAPGSPGMPRRTTGERYTG